MMGGCMKKKSVVKEEKVLAVCTKKDCLYYNSCQIDAIQRLLCGDQHLHYNIPISPTMSADMSKKLKELNDASDAKIASMGASLGINKEKQFTPQQYKMLVTYAIQENFRKQYGQDTPQRIKDKIQDIYDGRIDGILLQFTHQPKTIEVEREVVNEETGRKEIIKEKVLIKRGRKRDPNKRRIVDIAVECLKKKMTFEQTKQIVLKERPDSGFSMASFNWYKNKLQKGEIGQ